MKFEEYIAEASKYEMQAYSVVRSLYKNCMPFIQELRRSAAGNNDLVWRGTNKSRTKSIIRVTPRQDRIPKDTPPLVQEELDKRFRAKYGWEPRSTGVFTYPTERGVTSYGEPYMFFPVGKYKYLFNPDIDDLYAAMDDSEGFEDWLEGFPNIQDDWEDDWESEYGEGGRGEWSYDGISTGEVDRDEAMMVAAEAEGVDEEDLDEILFEWIPDIDKDDYINDRRIDKVDEMEAWFDRAINGYQSDNLKLAMQRKVEIMFGCKSYHLVSRIFENDIRKYVLQGKTMDFDPKQSRMAFEKIPGVRRGKQLKHPEDKRGPFEFQDAMGSKFGKTHHHPKNMYLIRKSSKGQQKKLK